MPLEFLRVKAGLFEQAKDLPSAIEVLLEVIRDNYGRPQAFQCIFDLHEDIIRHLISLNAVSSKSWTEFFEKTEVKEDQLL
jgi:hypothetical protein